MRAVVWIVGLIGLAPSALSLISLIRRLLNIELSAFFASILDLYYEFIAPIVGFLPDLLPWDLPAWYVDLATPSIVSLVLAFRPEIERIMDVERAGMAREIASARYDDEQPMIVVPMGYVRFVYSVAIGFAALCAGYLMVGYLYMIAMFSLLSLMLLGASIDWENMVGEWHIPVYGPTEVILYFAYWMFIAALVGAFFIANAQGWAPPGSLGFVS
jgi:hypothetical protein